MRTLLRRLTLHRKPVTAFAALTVVLALAAPAGAATIPLLQLGRRRRRLGRR